MRYRYNMAASQAAFARGQRPVRGQQLPAAAVGAPKWAFGALSHGMAQPVALGMPGANMPLYRNNSFNTALNSRQALYEVSSHSAAHRCAFTCVVALIFIKSSTDFRFQAIPILLHF